VDMHRAVVACWPRLPYTPPRLVVFNSSDSS